MRYVYIDGRSLQVAIDQFAIALGVDSLPFDFGMFINSLNADRAFFYDALPDKKNSEPQVEYETRRKDKESFLSKLSCVPNMHVRTGTSKWSKNGLKQKAVDTQLAVDVVSHAYSGVTKYAIFVASDLDFYPVLTCLIQTQVRTELVYRPDATDAQLIEAADRSKKLGHTMLLRACEPNFAAPYFTTTVHYTIPVSEKRFAKKFTMGGTEFFGLIEPDRSYSLLYNDSKHNAKTPQLVGEAILGENADLFIELFD